MFCWYFVSSLILSFNPHLSLNPHPVYAKYIFCCLLQLSPHAPRIINVSNYLLDYSLSTVFQRDLKKIFVILTCLNVCPIQRQHLFLTSPLPHLAVSIRSTSVFLSHRFSRLVESNQLMNASNFLIIVLFVHVSDSHDSTDLSIVWCWLCDVNWDYLLKK